VGDTHSDPPRSLATHTTRIGPRTVGRHHMSGQGPIAPLSDTLISPIVAIDGERMAMQEVPASRSPYHPSHGRYCRVIPISPQAFVPGCSGSRGRFGAGGTMADAASGALIPVHRCVGCVGKRSSAVKP
jgi:hypothetical protein